MYVRTYIRILCIYVCMFVRTYVRVYVYTCVRVYVCTCVRVYVCTFVRVYVRTYVRVCVRTYVCTWACVSYLMVVVLGRQHTSMRCSTRSAMSRRSSSWDSPSSVIDVSFTWQHQHISDHVNTTPATKINTEYSTRHHQHGLRHLNVKYFILYNQHRTW